MSDTLQSIEIFLVNPELFSGSGDSFRTELNQAWNQVEDTDGYQSADAAAEQLTLPSYIETIYVNPNQIEVVSSSALVKSFKTPVRLEGHSANIKSDDMWRAYIFGGTQTYEVPSEDSVEYDFSGIYSDNVYSDGFIAYKAPYTNKMAKTLNLKTGDSYASVTIQPRYNYHIPEYFIETTNPDRDPVSLINIHWYETSKDAESEGETNLIPQHIYNYITRENLLENLQGIDSDTPINTLLNKVTHQMLPPEESLNLGVDEDGDSSDDYMSDRNYNLRRYLSSSYIDGTISGSTNQQYTDSSRNLLYNSSNAASLLSSNSSVLTNREIYPYYVDIVIPSVNSNFSCTSADGSVLEEGQNQIFRDIFDSYGFDNNLLNFMYLFFDPGAGLNSANSELKNFIKLEHFLSGSEDSDSITSRTTINEQSYKTIDFVTFLKTAYNVVSNPLSIAEPAEGRSTRFPAPSFMSRLSNDILSATSYNSSAAIHINSQKTLLSLRDVLAYLSTNSFSGESVEELYAFAANSKYHETLAYRIEKTLNGNVVQNFWIYNSSELDDINFTDSQVTYGETYKYNIFRYIIQKELRYKFSDPICSEQITTTTTDDEEGVSFCLQFKDANNAPVEQLFDPEDDSFSLEGINTFADATKVIKSPVPYYADMIMEFETGIRLCEVPIGTKTVTLQDHPPSALDVIPFYVKDDSNIVGFQLNYEAFSKIKLPYPLNDLDKMYNSFYENSYDMLSGDKITYSSRSRLETIEVYRLSELPTKYEDFGPTPHKTYQMPIVNEKSSYGIVNCYDKIKSNQKYYYMFRAVNQLEVSGPLTEIYEIELVNDGGYNYLLTKIYHENDLSPTRYTNPVKGFKKLLHIRPAALQAQLNTTNVDYTQESNTQLENITLGDSNLAEPIWGKTFKLRLKSKKSGKKIDLNITYNLENG